MSKAIWAAYQDTGAIEIPCPHCGAPPNQWCTRSDGRVRRVPCIERSTSTAAFTVDKSTRYRDFTQPIHHQEETP